MATFAQTAPAAPELSILGLAKLKSRIARYRLYRRTLNELSALDARQLDDLGLRRDMLKRVAYQAAQEAA